MEMEPKQGDKMVISPAFSEFFSVAMGGGASPWPYQEELGQQPCVDRLIEVPTGCGKTAAAVLSWLYRSVILGDERWPKRLVFCLPMRTLVEQTEAVTRCWLQNIKNASDRLGLSEDVRTRIRELNQTGPKILMGGEERSELAVWHLHPEKHAILIGTQDMLLSRALNRGYGESRFRWPLSFGLLHSDCLWILDETQLMGVGVETSSQLQALRARIGTYRPSYTWWMSATLDRERFATVDAKPAEYEKSQLGPDDLAKLQTRLRARKPLRRASITAASSKGPDLDAYLSGLADLVVQEHREGTLTLVVLNRVRRAQGLAMKLRERQPDWAPVLIHSRFRPAERKEQLTFLRSAHPTGILIATQAVEAGVEIDARLLITELAPWSSLVQRAGRCNRRGEQVDARIMWVDLEPADKDLALPYEATALSAAREQLCKLDDLSLESVQQVALEEEPVVRPVLRRKDLIELFDTTPDLLGADLDISRYVRDGEDTDVQVFWRDLKDDENRGGGALHTQPAPSREELCRVSIASFAKWSHKANKASNRGEVFRWDFLEGRWSKAVGVVPGETYLIAASTGGYDSFLGWTGEAKHKPEVLLPEIGGDQPEAHGDDSRGHRGAWLSLREHTRHVEEELEAILAATELDPEAAAILRTAGHWHDVGKAHAVFQEKLRAWGTPHPDRAEIWAKSERAARPDYADISPAMKKRFRAFRHELASALGWLASPEGRSHPARDLVAYLIAAHHGKVRLSLRSVPNEPIPETDQGEPLFARGIWQGDVIPGLGLPELSLNGSALPPLTLDLRLIRAGGSAEEPSWLERMLGLRDDPTLGPFRLAALEALLRAADMRASAKEAEASSLTDSAMELSNA